MQALFMGLSRSCSDGPNSSWHAKALLVLQAADTKQLLADRTD